MKTADIIKDWMDATNQPTQALLIVMDSYYLSAEGRQLGLERERPLLAAIRENRFKSVTQYARKRVTNAGEQMFFFNENTGESIAYVFPTDPHIGRKVVYSNSFFLRSTPTAKNNIPLYDAYKASFNGCDKLNKALHGRNWPYRSGGNTRSGLDGSSFDYLLTCSLVNTYHAWLNAHRYPYDSSRYKGFMEALVRGLLA